MYTPCSRFRLTVAMEIMHFFIVQLSLSLRTKIICISWVLMNDLTPTKKCPELQGRSNHLPRYLGFVRYFRRKTYVQRMHEWTYDRIKQYLFTHRLDSSIVCMIKCISYILLQKNAIMSCFQLILVEIRITYT